MSFYANLATTAIRLLTKYGQSTSFTRTDGETHNPVTGAISGGSTTIITGNGVVFPYDKKEIDGTNILRTDMRVFFEPSSTSPAVDDKCTVNSVAYRVVMVQPLNPGGTAVLYTVQLRI